MTSDEIIQHFGVKGMKWGIRKDSKTGSGKENVSDISDNALRERVKRMELEKRYKTLVEEKRLEERGPIQKGADEAKNIVAKTAKQTIQQTTQNKTNEVINLVVKEIVKRIK